MLAAGADPKDHVVAHGLVRLFSDNIRLPLFKNQAPEFWFTNHLLMLLVASALMLVIFISLGQRYRALMAGRPITDSVPRGFAGAIEGMMDALRSGVVKPVLGADTDRFMPFLWTVFFFILICNLLGMIPIDALLGLAGSTSHVGGTPTGNINVTAGLALVAFLAIHGYGVAEVYRGLRSGTYGQHHGDDEHGDHGHAAGAEPAPVWFAAAASPIFYLWNFAPHVFTKASPRHRPPLPLRLLMVPVYTVLIALIMELVLGIFFGATGGLVGRWLGGVLGFVAGCSAPGVHPLDFADAVTWSLLFLLETIGAVVKPFALCMRLFANIVAGHIVLASILLLIPVFKGLTAGYLASSVAIAVGGLAISGLELFVAFLQAFVFMFLTTLFINLSVHPEH
jgi:F0F1-type ATP synthase membrane subunit a